MVDRLTQDEAREFGKAVAKRHGLSFDESAPRAAMDSLLRAIPSSAASLYLVELRRREAGGEILLRIGLGKLTLRSVPDTCGCDHLSRNAEAVRA